MKTKRDGSVVAAYVGAGVGLLGFIGIGAVPGLLYGGYAGLALAGVLGGTPVVATFASRLLVFGGMAIGALAVLSLFLVMGALLGTMGHLLWSFPSALAAALREEDR